MIQEPEGRLHLDLTPSPAAEPSLSLLPWLAIQRIAAMHYIPCRAKSNIDKHVFSNTGNAPGVMERGRLVGKSEQTANTTIPRERKLL